MRINREAKLRNDHVHARREQRVADKLDDFVRAVAQNQIRRFDAEFCRQFLFQIKRVAVGIKIQVRRCAFCIAASAAGDGPSGFSFEASLMMSSAGRPSSRATSSIGRPG